VFFLSVRTDLSKVWCSSNRSFVTVRGAKTVRVCSEVTVDMQKGHIAAYTG